MTTPAFPHDRHFPGFSNGSAGNFRAPQSPADLLVAAAVRLCERADLPLSVRKALHTLKQQTRRVAADRSGFATVMHAMMYVEHPADALWFPRLIEAEAYGRCSFPTLAPPVAHVAESESNSGFDVAQMVLRADRSEGAFVDFLDKALVQEIATRQLVASEANEMRVRGVLKSLC